MIIFYLLQGSCEYKCDRNVCSYHSSLCQPDPDKLAWVYERGREMAAYAYVDPKNMHNNCLLWAAFRGFGLLFLGVRVGICGVSMSSCHEGCGDLAS